MARRPSLGVVTPLVDLGGRSAWSVLPPLILGFFMIMVDTTIVNIAVPTLVTDLESSYAQVGWVNSAYLLTLAVFLLVCGRLGDRFGPRPVFIAGLAVFTAASAWCGFSQSIGELIAARAVQGVGAALMTPQTMSTITRVFPPQQRGAAMGLWGTTAGVATIAGPLLGGLLIEYANWEWIFFMNIPVGVVALVFAVRSLPRLSTTERSFDLWGVALSVVGMVLVVFGLQEGQSFRWGSVVGPVTVWHVIALGILVLGAFVAWQWRMGERALLPLTLFADRNYVLANLSGLTLSFAMIGIFFPLTIFLQSVVGLSPVQTALVNLPSSLISGLVAPFAGRLSDRIPAKWVAVIGFAALVGAVGWLALVVRPDAAASDFIPAMCLFGVGTGCVFSPLANLATSGLDASTAGAGAGAFNSMRQVGGVVGSAAIVATLTARLAVELPAAARREVVGSTLPEQGREAFVEQAAQWAGGAGAGPQGAGDVAGGSLRALVEATVHQGFAAAVAQTLALTAVVLVVGLCAALAMRARTPAP